MDKIVSVEVVKKEKWGRNLGIVILPDKINLNQELVRTGNAWWYREYAKSSVALPKLEEQAKTAKLGLWAKPAIPPWDWRDGVRDIKPSAPV